jgi:serine/threonine protein kinase
MNLYQTQEANLDELEETSTQDKNLSSMQGLIESHDKYYLQKLLAKGGMAYVFRARDLNCQRSVALKMIMDKEGNEEEITRRFIEEAQITSQLDHPSIVPIYELSQDAKGNPFYIMKLIKGRNLEELLTEIREGNKATIKQYSLTRLLTVFSKICDAIAFAASKNVVHRDIKPENIMIGQYGEVFLMDWGIAKVLNAEEIKQQPNNIPLPQFDPDFIKTISCDSSVNVSSTFHGQILGTPSFMAPEQVQSQHMSLTIRADIYALGGLLYNILTLCHPHEDNELEKLFRRKLTGQITPPHLRIKSAPHLPDKSVPYSLSAVAMKALQVNPADRYASANELQTDVQHWIDGYATEAEGASQARLFQLLFMRHRRLGFTIITLVIVAFFAMYQNHERLEIAIQEEQFASDLASSSEQKYLSQNIRRNELIGKYRQLTNVEPHMQAYLAILLDQEEHTKALDLARNLAQSFPTEENFIHLSDVHLAQQKPDLAYKTLMRALKKFPDSTLLSLKINKMRNK